MEQYFENITIAQTRKLMFWVNLLSGIFFYIIYRQYHPENTITLCVLPSILFFVVKPFVYSLLIFIVSWILVPLNFIFNWFEDFQDLRRVFNFTYWIAFYLPIQKTELTYIWDHDLPKEDRIYFQANIRESQFTEKLETPIKMVFKYRKHLCN